MTWMDCTISHGGLTLNGLKMPGQRIVSSTPTSPKVLCRRDHLKRLCSTSQQNDWCALKMNSSCLVRIKSIIKGFPVEGIVNSHDLVFSLILSFLLIHVPREWHHERCHGIWRCLRVPRWSETLKKITLITTSLTDVYVLKYYVFSIKFSCSGDWLNIMYLCNDMLHSHQKAQHIYIG